MGEDLIKNWFAFDIMKQMGSVGIEVGRAIKWKNKNSERKIDFTIKAIELIGLSKIDPQNVNRFHELHLFEQQLLDYMLGENLYNNTDDSIMKPYNQFLLGV